MPLFDIFKKKKKEKEPKSKIEEKKEKVEVKPLPAQGVRKKNKVEVKPLPTQGVGKKKVSDRAEKVLHSPHITEKATDFEKENKYVFRVWPRANKTEIKKAIEDTYGVDVVGVRIINIHRRRRRLGRQRGWKKGHKKAIVKIKEGQKIEILPR